MRHPECQGTGNLELAAGHLPSNPMLPSPGVRSAEHNPQGQGGTKGFSRQCCTAPRLVLTGAATLQL